MKTIIAPLPVRAVMSGLLTLVALATVTLQIQGASCTQPPSGLVSWWPGENNANDVVGGNNGLAQNITYDGGEVGSAFYLNGSNAYVKVPASASLNVGTGNGFTFETWINPLNINNHQALAEWNNNAGDAGIGAHLFLTESQYPTLGAAPPGCIYANLIDTSGGSHVFSTGGGVVVSNTYQHIALTYDKASGIAVLYRNGIAVQTSNLGTFTPQTSYDFYLGERASGTDAGSYFGGTMDEPSLYNRALSATEIASIYNAGSAGKCAPAAASCVTPPAGLVGWWKGDGNTLDSYAGNNGVNQNVTYTNGVVGQAFAFDPENYSYGTYTGIQIADQPAYALTNSLTIEGWVRPRGNGFIIFWRGDNRPGLDPYVISMQDNNTVLFQISDANGNGANVGATLSYHQWCHLAATLDGSSGTMSIYTNGVLAAQTNTTIRPFGPLIPGNSPGIGIGNLNDGQNNFPFIGDIDEISLYSRALAAGEIQAIYNAGSAGKCTTTSTAVPVISNFAPASGTDGTVVTIAGTNFNATASADIVYFGAVRANVLTASPTSLTVTVPAGATYAPITVTVNGLIAYASAPFLATFIGSGSASLAPRLDLPSANGPGFTAFADLDGDGKPDLLVLSGSVLSIYQNLGTTGIVTTNSFASRLDLPLPAGMDAMTVADVDGDGKLDVVLLNDSSNQVMILKNISSPGILTTNSFAAPVVFATGNDPRGLAVQDLDGDGRPELIVGNWADSTVSVFHNTGAGGIATNSFAPAAPSQRDRTRKAWPLRIWMATDSRTSSRPIRPISPVTVASLCPCCAISAPWGILRLRPRWITPVCRPVFTWRLGIWTGMVNWIWWCLRLTSASPSRCIATPARPAVSLPARSRRMWISLSAAGATTWPSAIWTATANPISPWSRNCPTTCPFSKTSARPAALRPARWPRAWIIRRVGSQRHRHRRLGRRRPARYCFRCILWCHAFNLPEPDASNRDPAQHESTSHPFANSQPSCVAGQHRHLQRECHRQRSFELFLERNGVLISGATNSSYSLINAQLSDSGSKFSCLVTNAYGSAGSTNVTLKVIDTIANDLCSGAIVITNASYTNVQSTLKASSLWRPGSGLCGRFWPRRLVSIHRAGQRPAHRGHVWQRL